MRFGVLGMFVAGLTLGNLVFSYPNRNDSVTLVSTPDLSAIGSNHRLH
jgi:hypothetical protein